MEQNQAAQHQPAPTRSDRPAIQDLVIQDLQASIRLGRRGAGEDGREDLSVRVIEDIDARKQVGLERYGTLLQAFNGRDALMDAYQEALDLVVYQRQVLEEKPENPRVRFTYEQALDICVILRKTIEERDHAVV